MHRMLFALGVVFTSFPAPATAGDDLEKVRAKLRALESAERKDECNPVAAADLEEVFEAAARALSRNPAARRRLLREKTFAPLRARVRFHVLVLRRSVGNADDLAAMLPHLTFYGNDWGSAPGSQVRFRRRGVVELGRFDLDAMKFSWSKGRYRIDGATLHLSFGPDRAWRAKIEADGTLRILRGTPVQYVDRRQGVCDA